MPIADFFNDALGICGFERITSIDDGSTNANWCATFWPNTRKSALMSADWSFASARAVLTQDPVAPAFEFSYQYVLPTDFLIIREYNGAILTPSAVDPQWWYVMAGRYRIEGLRLLTNEAEVKIRYTKDVTDPEQWSPLFYKYARTLLASELAPAIGKDVSKGNAFMEKAEAMELPKAAGIDGQQGTITPYRVDDLTRGR